MNKKSILYILTIAIFFYIGYSISNTSKAEEGREADVYQFVIILHTAEHEKLDDNTNNIETEEMAMEDEDDYSVYEVTAYTSGRESTGKTPSHPAYGITASGVKVEEGVTIACPKTMDFGTEVYIPYFDNTFECQDRGGAITEGKLDVYIEDLDAALKFGRRKLDVQILSSDKE